MKAVICPKYGPPEVLKLTDIPKPEPKENEVLIKIMATTVHRGDTRMRSLNFPSPVWQQFIGRIVLGYSKPKNKILGMDLAGIIEETGKNVTKYKIGDKVFSSTSWAGFGTYSEYKCIDEKNVLTLMPSNMTFEEAAVIPSGGITALWLAKKADLKENEKVLIYGASGSIGTFFLQFAKNAGAEVTAVASTENMKILKKLGVDHIIDYKIEDFTKMEERYDVIMDAVDKVPAKEAKNTLLPKGRYLNIHTTTSLISAKEAGILLQELKELAEAEKLKSVIDRSYPIESIVEAHRYVDTGRKKGNVCITL